MRVANFHELNFRSLSCHPLMGRDLALRSCVRQLVFGRCAFRVCVIVPVTFGRLAFGSFIFWTMSARRGTYLIYFCDRLRPCRFWTYAVFGPCVFTPCVFGMGKGLNG